MGKVALVTALSFIVTLALVACSDDEDTPPIEVPTTSVPASSSSSDDETKPTEISESQLAYMVLDHSELGKEYDDFFLTVESGFETNDDYGGGDSAYIRNLVRMGRLTGYKDGYANYTNDSGVFFVQTSVSMFRDTAGASELVQQSLQDAEESDAEGVTTSSITPFDTPRIGDEAVGFVARRDLGAEDGEGGSLFGTHVVFRVGSLTADVQIASDDDEDIRSDATDLAAKLEQRIAGVISGDIEPWGDQSIAFTSTLDAFDDNNWEIDVVKDDGTGRKQLTNNPAMDTEPAWSPDGAKIAFVSDRDGNDEIYVMNRDGSSQARLTESQSVDAEPAWSPDGSRIAFYSDRDGNDELYVMNVDGSGVVRLTNNDAVDAAPAWSPDGTTIAFYSDRDGNLEIYAIDADGTDARRVTNTSANESSPDWSPEGTRLVVSSDHRIAIIEPDGTTEYTWEGGSDGEGNGAYYPEWSPDGARIVFELDMFAHMEIFVAEADGSNQTALTVFDRNIAPKQSNEGPSW